MSEKKKMKRNCPRLCWGTFTKLDMFGEGVNFKVDGEDTYKTPLGAILTTVVFLVMTFYANQKLSVLFDRGDTNYSSFAREGEVA